MWQCVHVGYEILLWTSDMSRRNHADLQTISEHPIIASNVLVPILRNFNISLMAPVWITWRLSLGVMEITQVETSEGSGRFSSRSGSEHSSFSLSFFPNKHCIICHRYSYWLWTFPERKFLANLYRSHSFWIPLNRVKFQRRSLVVKICFKSEASLVKKININKNNI